MNELEWFEEAYRQNADFCFHLGRHYLHEGQDEDVLYDMVQDVFMTLWNKRAELIAHPNVGGWLALAVRYRMMSRNKEQRKQNLHHAYSLDEEHRFELTSPQLTPEQQTELWGRIDTLREILGEEDSLLFLAYAIGGYKAKELGVRFDLTENTVHVRISRMKKKLVAHPELFYALLLVSMGALRMA